MRTLSRWIGFGIWIASALILAYMARSFWPSSRMTRAWVVMLGDSEGIQSTTEVAYQGVVVGNVKSVRLYPFLEERRQQDLRGFIFSLPAEKAKGTWQVERTILVEVSLDSTLVRLDRPLFADVSHSKFTGRPLIDLLSRPGSPVPSETKGPFIRGPFAEPSNMVENVTDAINTVLDLGPKVDTWWVKEDGRAKLEKLGDKVAGFASSFTKMQETLHPKDGSPDPIDRVNRSLESLAKKIPDSQPGTARAGEFLPGLAKFREESLPKLQNGLTDLLSRVREEWGRQIEAFGQTVWSLRSSLSDAVESMARTNRKLKAQVEKLEDSHGMLKDMMSGEGK